MHVKKNYTLFNMELLNLNLQDYLHIFSTWGYAVMLLLMIVEGPITTMSAAFLASLGYFNIFIVVLLSILGDVIGDILLYSFGYFGGRRALRKIEKVFKIEQNLIKRLEKFFEEKGAKTIFYVKITTGLCFITFFLAGVSKMKFKKFISFSVLGGFFWSIFLSVIGYFFGYAAEEIGAQLTITSRVIFGLFVLCVIFIMILRKKFSKKVIKE